MMTQMVVYPLRGYLYYMIYSLALLMMANVQRVSSAHKRNLCWSCGIFLPFLPSLFNSCPHGRSQTPFQFAIWNYKIAAVQGKQVSIPFELVEFSDTIYFYYYYYNKVLGFLTLSHLVDLLDGKVGSEWKIMMIGNINLWWFSRREHPKHPSTQTPKMTVQFYISWIGHCLTTLMKYFLPESQEPF